MSHKFHLLQTSSIQKFNCWQFMNKPQILQTLFYFFFYSNFKFLSVLFKLQMPVCERLWMLNCIPKLTNESFFRICPNILKVSRKVITTSLTCLNTSLKFSIRIRHRRDNLFLSGMSCIHCLETLEETASSCYYERSFSWIRNTYAFI